MTIFRHSEPMKETVVRVLVGIGMIPWMITRITLAKLVAFEDETSKLGR